MVPVILILILAFIALCNGDSSGFEAIGKVILYIGLFIGVGAIIVYAPWLILVVIVGVIIWAVTSLKSHSSNSSPDNIANNHYVDYKQQSDRIEAHSIDNSNLTDFQRQLQENTKTPKQVEDENWLKEKEHVIKNAQGDYKYIKDQLVEKAKNGDYINLDQQKQIIYNFECSFLLSCINRKYSSNPSGRIGTSSYKPNEKVDYYINNSKQYYLYLNTIKELAQIDNISIKEIFISKKDSADNGTYVNIPYTYTNTILVRFHQIKVILECLIRY